MLIASEWPTKTGTRTQVAVTLIFGSRIFLVSTTIFHSSLVKPSSRKTSICGITLKAICLVNFFGATSWPGTKRPLRLLEQLVHALLARAGNRLIGRDDDALDPGAVVQRLQRHHHLRGRAVGVGDDVLVLVAHDRVGVHLGHDQRHVRVQAVERRVVDHDAAGRRSAGRVDLRRLGPDGEQGDVPAGEIEVSRSLVLTVLSPKLISVPMDCATQAPRSRPRETRARRGCSAFRGPHCPWHRRRRHDNPFVHSRSRAACF